MQTSCLYCDSLFLISSEQLEMARGQARCSQCGNIFNALLTLENFEGSIDQIEHVAAPSMSSPPPAEAKVNPPSDEKLLNQSEIPVSLDQAMYGENYRRKHSMKPVMMMAGILLLGIALVIQVVYYQRYRLMSSPTYQSQIIGLCSILPCDPARFESLSQINLIERNVFTHPTRSNALMVSGSFRNEASFSQALPNLKISLSNVQGKLIANRVFSPDEYLSDQNLNAIQPMQVVLFRLEIIDPGNQALTYEFEFLS